ncbi:MAG: EVE domain-containing protein [Gemmatimonadota bacterium]|nr:MAG: EVE domain-containing protein [Gemmatimonadota bacterium]
MNYWLMKSEPDVYSIDDLARDGSTHWEGVRNYSARNNMRKMELGDLVLFYHSNAKPPGVAGIARVVKTAYPDPHQWDRNSKYHDPKSTKDDPRWSMVDVEFVEQFAELVPLDRIKATMGLENMVLVKRSRLSVQPVTPQEFAIVKRLGKG